MGTNHEPVRAVRERALAATIFEELLEGSAASMFVD
jgi:hypothetical protein